MEEDQNNNNEDEEVESENDNENVDDFDDDMDDDSLDDSDDDSDAELDNISMGELEEMAAITARSLFMVQMQLANRNAAEAEGNLATDSRGPIEKWQELLANLNKVKVLKITDADTRDMTIDDLKKTNPVLDGLLAAIRQHSGLTHVILEGAFLKSFQDKQRILYQAIWTTHCRTLTYLKLGSKSSPPSILDISSLLSILKAPTGPNGSVQMNLTEIELSSFSIQSAEHVHSLQAALGHGSKLKQINLLGIQIAPESKSVGLIDELLRTVAGLSALDECQFSCVESSPAPLISSSCLSEALAKKPKWWRLGLDGVGLNDEHCRTIAKAMSNDTCKAGDLLSLARNPSITNAGFSELFSVLFQKQRMGLVKVDDSAWQANFDLVRSMNNLHGRLLYLEERSGSYASRLRWLDWLAKLSQITWEDEAHKVNYLW
eukprot:CAMPEP_0198151416 /NCGR_PEP_ID=MMETSP1443-20131203/55532_1 /TAXON_ID=186043 /ORGANISM="Entomoneis sp., Strain CCMP2396" /LENGTH=431 /DNA_ID=CAMNT_0043817065 /DNA_START=52 /DNA_END=1344 /DNA_ORIENTATION=+